MDRGTELHSAQEDTGGEGVVRSARHCRTGRAQTAAAGHGACGLRPESGPAMRAQAECQQLAVVGLFNICSDSAQNQTIIHRRRTSAAHD